MRPPPPLDPGEGTDADRLRMLQHQRNQWANDWKEWRERLSVDLDRIGQDHLMRTKYWDSWRDRAKELWATRQRFNRRTVANYSILCEQWHPDNPPPSEMPAGFNGSPGLLPPKWVCPLDDSHTWRVWPKDRISRGTRCPRCQVKATVADCPLLLDQWDDNAAPGETALGSHQEVSWKHQTWAVVPDTGEWQWVTHRWRSDPKTRTGQLDACLVCAGFVVDKTTSFASWFPALADELVSEVDPAALSPGSHSGGKKKYEWRCRRNELHPNWTSTILNRVNDNGCPRCRSRGVSERQAYIAAEIASLGALAYRADRMHGLPDDVPDLCSYQLDIPPDIRDRYRWRRFTIEVDILIDADGHQIAVEYDGAGHHGGRYRDDAEVERRKDSILRALGIPVIRVREYGLPTPVREGLQVIEIGQEAPWCVAVKIFERIHKITGWVPDGLQSYRSHRTNQAKAEADAFLTFYRGPKEKKKRSPRPPQVPRPRRPRSVVPIGSKIGRLKVRSDVMLDATLPPRSSRRWWYEVDCDCGETGVIKTHTDLARKDGKHARYCSRRCPLLIVRL